MKPSKDRSEFIKALREMPLISYAAKKVGISRATIYRWMKDDLTFRNQTNEVMKEGRKWLGDFAEMSLIKQIEKGNLKATIFYLVHNSKRYMPKRIIPIKPIKKLEVGQICDACGHEEAATLSQIDIKKYIRRNHEYVLANPDFEEKDISILDLASFEIDPFK